MTIDPRSDEAINLAKQLGHSFADVFAEPWPNIYEIDEPADIDQLSIFCDGCGRALVTGQNCEACEMSQLYLITRSIVRVAFWLALATVAGLSTALLYAWINPHA